MVIKPLDCTFTSTQCPSVCITCFEHDGQPSCLAPILIEFKSLFFQQGTSWNNDLVVSLAALEPSGFHQKQLQLWENIFFHVHTESLFPASEIVLQEYNTKFVQIAVYSQFANCYSINKERKLALFQLTIKSLNLPFWLFLCNRMDQFKTTTQIQNKPLQ